MATYGKVGEHKEDEEWVKCVERLTHNFTANEIKDKDKQSSIFLSVCGAKTIQAYSESGNSRKVRLEDKI